VRSSIQAYEIYSGGSYALYYYAPCNPKLRIIGARIKSGFGHECRSGGSYCVAQQQRPQVEIMRAAGGALEGTCRPGRFQHAAPSGRETWQVVITRVLVEHIGARSTFDPEAPDPWRSTMQIHQILVRPRDHTVIVLFEDVVGREEQSGVRQHG